MNSSIDVGAYEFKGAKAPGHGTCQAGVSRRIASSTMALAPLAALQAATAVDNSVTIQNRSDQAQPNRPVSVSRFFASGDIPKFAEAVVGGAAIPTQCDVKTRWPDGSLQHAVVSFSVNLPAKGSAKVAFRNQAQGNNEGFLKAPDMLSDKFNLGGVIEITGAGGQKFAIDIRKMITDGSFQYWLKGPQCTQVIVEDRTQAFKYDVGFDARKSLHPIFVATFYPAWKGVKIEMILENMWFSKLQDQTYSVALRTGNPLKPEPAYSKTNFRHSALTRWRKIVWSGPTPGAINIDYNLPYMVRSKALPNYDVSKKVSDKAIRKEIAAFQATDRGEIGGFAQWTTKMWGSGANERGDIGLAPRWYVLYLFTFDPGLYEVMLGNAAMSASVPIHFRDSVPGVYFDSAKKTSSFGRVLSVEGRPTVRTGKWVGDSSPQDEIRPVGPIAENVWNADQQHQPSFAYVPYLITGDWYFLEEMYFWSAWNLAWPNPTLSYNKGEYTRYGAFGYLNENGIEARGAAWTLRTLGETAFLAPDGSPEKKYFTGMMHNNIAVKEGVFDIRDGAFCNPDSSGACSDPRWKWGRKAVGADRPNPLFIVSAGAACVDGGQVCDADVDPAKATRANSPWMFNYTHMVLGRLREMGFPMAKLQSNVAKSLLHQLLDPGYNPYMVEEYRIPTTDKAGNYFTSWRTLAEAYTVPQKRLSKRQFIIFPELAEGGYVHIARAAASYLPGVNDGALKGEDAWKWMIQHEPAQHLLNDNPKWALVPRQ